MSIESKLQSKIITYLHADGWEVVKTIVLSKSGYEDMFCFRNGVTMFIEAKAEDKKPRLLQQFRIDHHNATGFYSFFANSWEMFLEKYNAKP